MLTASLLLFAVVALLLLLGMLYVYHSYSRMRELTSKMAGPKTLPLLGNTLEFGTTTTDFFYDVLKLWKNYGTLIRVWLGPKLFVLMTDPKDVEVVLSSPKYIDKSMMYQFFHSWLGTGLLTSSGKKWHTNRKIITPTFHFKILEEFVDVFNINGNIMIDNLKQKVNGPGFDIHMYVTLCALDNICESAMGVSVHAQKNSDSKYVIALREQGGVVMKRAFKPWLYPNFLFNLTNLGRKEKKCLEILHNMTNKVIKERKQQQVNSRSEKTNGHINHEADIGQKKRMAFLDLLLESSQNGANLTDENIREEVDTFMFEGHDTTTSGICFALWLLAKHPDIQEKAVSEVKEVLGSAEKVPTMQNLQELKYLERVIKETLRLYPSVPVFGRELFVETQLVTDDIILPANTSIMIAAYGVHRHPDHFPDPERFDPDRFLPENIQGRHPYAYIPFSAGPRNCIGQKFAMLEMKATVSKVLLHYQLLPDPEQDQIVFSAELILKSANGIKLKLVPREQHI